MQDIIRCRIEIIGLSDSNENVSLHTAITKYELAAWRDPNIILDEIGKDVAVQFKRALEREKSKATL